MNKIALYILLILVFLGASRSFRTERQNLQFVKDQTNYSSLFKGEPLTLILLDAYRAGLVIKSNIHKYKVIRFFKETEIINLRVSNEYFKRSLPNIGMSLFRRSEDKKESTIPMPPGRLFIGDPGYGGWIMDREKGKVWRFYRAYRGLKNQLLWGDFIPSYRFHRQARTFEKEGLAYYGLNNEFGSEGSITQDQLEMKWYKSQDKKFSFKEYLDTLTKLPFLRKK